MKNILISFFENRFKNKNKCTHKNALLTTSEGYCPDCGQYLKKNYYLIRCTRCDIKRTAKLCWGEVVPEDKYCSNCGETDYYIEKLDSVNFIDAKYAVYLKEIEDEFKNRYPESQIWVEEDNNTVKLLGKCCDFKFTKVC